MKTENRIAIAIIGGLLIVLGLMMVTGFDLLAWIASLVKVDTFIALVGILLLICGIAVICLAVLNPKGEGWE